MISAADFCKEQDALIDKMEATLGVVDHPDFTGKTLICHWQEEPPSFVIQLTRHSDGKTLVKTLRWQ